MPERLVILILTYTTFSSEPRALKQARYLRDAHDVTTAGYGSAPLGDVDHVELTASPAQRWGFVGRVVHLAVLGLRVHGLITRLSARDREVHTELGHQAWDVVIAHDLWSLEAALGLRPRLGVVLDLHEYAPAEATHSRIWRLVMRPYVEWLLRKKMPLAAQVVTVGEGIAERYLADYKQKSIVVTNATPFHDIVAGPAGDPLRLVHSGVAAPERCLDRTIEAVVTTSANVTLDLYLVDNGSGEIARLRSVAGADPRVRFCDPVPYARLVETLSAYDIGVSVFPPVTFNLEWCLPNKFFDFIQARLAVIVGPSPEMARIVHDKDLGLVLADFETATLARALETISASQVVLWKQSAGARAWELSSERQMDVWGEIIASLTDLPSQ